MSAIKNFYFRGWKATLKFFYCRFEFSITKHVNFIRFFFSNSRRKLKFQKFHSSLGCKVNFLRNRFSPSKIKFFIKGILFVRCAFLQIFRFLKIKKSTLYTFNLCSVRLFWGKWYSLKYRYKLVLCSW